MLPSPLMTAGGVLLVVLLVAGPIGVANAAPETAVTKVRLELRADPDCVSRADLAARVAARTPHIQFADDASIRAEVGVTSTRSGEVVAELVLGAPGAEPPRRVVARSCVEVANALAFIVAVTLDPTQPRKPPAGVSPRRDLGKAGDGRSANSQRDAPTDTSTAAPPDETTSRPRAVPPPSPPRTEPPPPLAPTPPPAPVALASAPGRRELGATLAVQTIFGVAPTVMPGVALYGMAALDRPGLWAPALFLGATHAWRSDLGEPGGKASFTLDAGSLDACPLRWRWSGLSARPCASALVGSLSARGTNTDHGMTSVRPFGVSGATLIAGLDSKVEVSVRLSVGAALVRDSYEFASNVFFRTGAIVTSASLGIGTRWP